MLAVSVFIPYLNVDALNAALLAALPGKALALSDYGRIRTSTLWMADDSTMDEQQTAINIALAHDPVTLSQDKAVINANGTDAATVTVTAFRPDAAPVVLVLTHPSGETETQTVNMSNGIGTSVLTATITGQYTMALQNPVNRCADTIVITAQ